MSFTPVAAFVPHPMLRNAHAMTIAPAFFPRRWDAEFCARSERRLFKVAEDAHVLAHCHWQDERAAHSTLIVLHGLEGSSESAHVMSIAQKGFAAGMNTIRLNLRNCGGTMALSRTLYNAGLSADLIAVARELRAEGLPTIDAVGYSLGGNVVIKAAGELGSRNENLLRAAIGISPAIDLDLCVQAIGRPSNRIYDLWFLRTLKKKIEQKELMFPGTFDLAALERVNNLRQFDDIYTAPDAGYKDASDYYFNASAARVIDKIRIPTLIIAAEDDPLVPFSIFEEAVRQNPNIQLVATHYGGHAGFVQRYTERTPTPDRFWAENCVVDFCQELDENGR